MPTPADDTTATGLAIPEVLSAQAPPPDHPLEETTYDVIVVGLGVAGGSAALAAAESGARVLVLERAAEAGGTSAMAGGHFYLGGGTAVQEATGQPDTPDAMFAYLRAVAPGAEEDKVRAYADGSTAHLDWLEALGFEFERSYYPEKAVIQPGTEGLMYTANEKVHPYRDIARPAPRGHKVPKPGDTGGGRIVTDLLRDRLVERGAEIRYETGATHLVTSTGAPGDPVVGVAWRHFGQRGIARAAGVVIAAGGFVMNEDMVARYTPALGSKLITLGSTYDDGLGLRLGRSVGAAWENMTEPFITAPFYPPSSLVTGIVVNSAGERFVAEDSYHARTSSFVMDQPGSVAYLIVDSAHIEHPDFTLTPFIDGWETIEEMEAGLGVPEGSLVATLRRYNEYAARGEDPDLGKHPDWLAPQDQGPWGAFDLTLGKALYAGFTLGGMRCDVDGRVLTEAGTVVAGLYAAGACASNIVQDGKCYASGLQLGEGSFFGRRAGSHAARSATDGGSARSSGSVQSGQALTG